jgi:hypothetical protein
VGVSPIILPGVGPGNRLKRFLPFIPLLSFAAKRIRRANPGRRFQQDLLDPKGIGQSGHVGQLVQVRHVKVRVDPQVDISLQKLFSSNTALGKIQISGAKPGKSRNRLAPIKAVSSASLLSSREGVK